MMKVEVALMLKIEVKNTMSEQFQLEYAVYMMIGSYFKKVNCLSKRIETKLFLHYQDLGFGKQEKLENKVIAFIEGYLLRGLAISGMENKEVSILFIPYSFGTIVKLEGNDFAVCFTVRQHGGRLQYSLVPDPYAVKSLKWIPVEEAEVHKKRKVGTWIAV